MSVEESSCNRQPALELHIEAEVRRGAAATRRGYLRRRERGHTLGPGLRLRGFQIWGTGTSTCRGASTESSSVTYPVP